VLARVWLWQHDLLVIAAICAAFAVWKHKKYHLRRLGIRPWPFSKRHWFAMAFIAFLSINTVASIYGFGIIFNSNLTVQSSDLLQLPKALAYYFGWACFQQLWMNGYFGIRLKTMFRHKVHDYLFATCLTNGILFSIVHIPNLVLFITTFIGGGLGTYFFFKTRNLYIIALAHAIVAIAIGYFLPNYVHHNLRIGPGF